MDLSQRRAAAREMFNVVMEGAALSGPELENATLEQIFDALAGIAANSIVTLKAKEAQIAARRN